MHYPMPVHLQPGYQAYGAGEGALPVAEALARSVVSLPLFVGLTEEEQLQVAVAVARLQPSMP